MPSVKLTGANCGCVCTGCLVMFYVWVAQNFDKHITIEKHWIITLMQLSTALAAVPTGWGFICGIWPWGRVMLTLESWLQNSIAFMKWRPIEELIFLVCIRYALFRQTSSHNMCCILRKKSYFPPLSAKNEEIQVCTSSKISAPHLLMSCQWEFLCHIFTFPPGIKMMEFGLEIRNRVHYWVLFFFIPQSCWGQP